MPERSEARRISASADALTIEWADGGMSEFTSLWLRDNRAEDRDAHSGQRLIDIADVPELPRIRSATRWTYALSVAGRSSGWVNVAEVDPTSSSAERPRVVR